jgi:predicted ferric reductase
MTVRGLLWLSFYLVLIALPLGVAAIWPGAAAGRPPLMQFGVACGFIAFTILGLEFSLISKIQPVASAFGMDALIQFHRQMGLVATVFLFAHAGALLYAGYPLEWLNPLNPDCGWAMRWGLMAFGALVLLVLLTLWRKQLRLAYEWWLCSHGILSKILVLAGLAHLFLFGGFSSQRPMRILLGVYMVGLVAISIYFQILKPLRMWSRPWKLVENRRESFDTRTLRLKPEGHPGFTFEPGQFAWLSTCKTPFHKDRHPISMSSAAVDELGQTIDFTIKDLGDWSGQIVPKLAAGTTVWVDGPYGVFSPDREQGPGYVLIGGGVGITPLVSMCQTFAARGDQRPVYLFYGSKSVESLRFREELESLESRMNLKLIYALEEPPASWPGESGYITAPMLSRHLPNQFKRYQYFICGPGPMMDSIERLLPQLGIPTSQIHTERFVMV